MSIQDQERAFHLWAASSGAINHREALGGLYWAQAAWKHQQARIDQLEKELAEAWKDAERMRVGAITKALEIVNCEYDKNQAAQDIYVSTRERLIQEMGKS